MLYDKIPLVGVEGHIKVEVRDDLTQKLIEKVEGKNGITGYGQARLKNLLKGLLGIGGSYSEFNFATDDAGEFNTSLNGVELTNTLYKYVVLTSDDTPFSVSDAELKGSLTGYSSRSPVLPSSAPLAGQFNIEESFNGASNIKMVYDFPTDRANGEHKSIHLARSYLAVGTDMIFPSIARSLRHIIKSPVSSIYGIVFIDGDFLYHVYGTNIYKINILTNDRTVIPFTGFSTSNNNMYENFGTIYNNKMYIFTRSNGLFYEIDMTTWIGTSLTLPTMMSTPAYRPIRLGQYLYYIYNNKMYRYDLVSKTSATPLSLPSNITGKTQFGFLQNNNYCIQCSDGIYSYDWVTNSAALLVGGTYAYFNTYWQYGYSNPLRVVLENGANSSYLIKTTSFLQSGSLDQFILYDSLDMAYAHDSVFSKKVFDVPVVKNNTQTMKVTYTLNFV